MKKSFFFFFGMLFTLSVSANQKVSEALQEYAWDKRQLIVFSPSHEDPQYQLFLKLKDEFREDFDDRKLHVWHVIAGQKVKLDEQIVSDLKSQDFQAAFGVNKTDFNVVLIGYDQEEKLRQNKVQIDYLFAEIDQMPMRIQEMQEDVN